MVFLSSFLFWSDHGRRSRVSDSEYDRAVNGRQGSIDGIRLASQER